MNTEAITRTVACAFQKHDKTMAQFTLHLFIFTREILTWKPKTILPRHDSRRYSGTNSSISFTCTMIPRYTHRARSPLILRLNPSVPINSSPAK